MASVPNQRIITVKKAKTDKNNLYTVLNLQALENACKTLESKAGFKLFMYCASNQDNYTFALSREDFMQYANCAETAYRSAVKELIEKGYFVEREAKGRYYFNEYGRMSEEKKDKPKSDKTELPMFSF